MVQQPILQVRDLVARLKFGKDVWTVVDRLNFNLYAGQTLALVGESGCGKSLTALSLMRILPTPPALPLEGKVLYRGQNLLEISEREMRKIRGGKIAMVFQDPQGALNPVYTIENQMIEAAELHLNLYGAAASERALHALDEVGITSPAKTLKDYPHQLSGGMKQRVMIAMALMCEPDILIADEPTTALDTTIQAQVLKLMRDLQEKKGIAILLITHDMGVVAEMADDIIVMYAAQGVEQGSIHELFSHPSHPYTKGLFHARPAIQVKGKKLEAIPGNVPSFKHIPTGCRFHPRCRFAMEKCKSGQVPTFQIEQESNGKLIHDHLTRCWLYDKSVESKQKLS